MLPQAVSDHYRAQQRLIVGTLALTRQEWAAMSLADLDGSWANVAPRVQLLTASAQLGSARNGAGYVAATLDEFGEDLTPAGLVNPRAFAGVASDGRPLSSLLDGALYRAKRMNSLESGGKWLDMAVHTQIADAGRSSASVAIASYDDVGWVRMVNPPCCGLCAVLAGKKYRYNQGFERHPRCDCVHIPSTLANPADNMGVNPSLDQITDLTDGERKALAEGADLPQVINARRRRSRDKMSTLEGMARKPGVRLTPDGIFAQAKNREEALDLLRQHGYLSPYGRAVRVTPWSGAIRPTAQVAERAATYVAEIAAAKTPADVGAALQRAIGERGKVIGFDAAGLDADTVRRAASSVADLFDEFPEVRASVRIVAEKEAGTIARARAQLVGGGRYGDMSLDLSLDKMRLSPGDLDDFIRESVARGHFHIVGDIDATRYVTSHEFGHLIDFSTYGTKAGPIKGKASSNEVLRGMFHERGISSERGKDAKALRDANTSGYGRTSRNEAIAEAVADVRVNGDQAFELSKRIYAELLRRLKSGAK